MIFKLGFVVSLALGAFALNLDAQAGTEKAILASTQPVANSCDSPQMQEWFAQCIYRRANCWEYNPGGYCHGAPSAWGRCTGRRPPMYGC